MNGTKKTGAIAETQAPQACGQLFIRWKSKKPMNKKLNKKMTKLNENCQLSRCSQENSQITKSMFVA